MRRFPLVALALIIILVHLALWLTLGSLVSAACLEFLQLTPGQAYASLFSPNLTSLYSDRGRTNILLIGQGGPNHAGGDLSDTLILASIPLDNSAITLIPIPRDLWISDLNAKINAAYEQGENKGPGYGFATMRQAISQVTNLPVHYYIQVDFNSFSQVIDALGGVDVQVANSFTDKKYPIPGMENAIPESSRYETITFDQGLTHMDGPLALKFVRSRNSESSEGTDLARSARQEQVIKAVISKMITPSTWQDKNRISSLIKIIQTNLKTDIHNSLFIDLFRLSIRHRQPQVNTLNIPTYIGNGLTDYSPEEALLIHPATLTPYFGQWVLVPKNADFNLIHDYLNCKIFNSNCHQ